MELLQEINEDQILGWKLKKNVKWPIVHLFVRKMRQILKHMMSAWMQAEKLRGDEFR